MGNIDVVKISIISILAVLTTLVFLANCTLVLELYE